MPDILDRQGFLERVRQVRREACGDDGVVGIARAIGIPVRTWENYEAGVTIPDLVLLQFVCLTGASPLWLLMGEGPTFSARSRPMVQRG